MSKSAVARSARVVGKEERKSQLDDIRDYRHTVSATELVNELQQWTIDDGEHKDDHFDDDDHDSNPHLTTSDSTHRQPSTARKNATAASQPSAPCKMALIFRDDVFSSVFSFVDGHSAALLCCVCQSFNSLLQDPIVWQHCASHYWGDPAHSATLLGRYNNAWKQMVIDRPHARLDGIYVLETKYWKPGGERFGEKQQRIIEVTYYRYLHFHPGGRLYYALLNTPPSLFHPLPTASHPQLRPAQYLYSSHGHHIHIKVDVGHEVQYMKLQMRQTRGEERWGGVLNQGGKRVAEGGAWNRLRVVEFKEKAEKEKQFCYYNPPSTEFLFYMTSGIQTFEDEEEKERMRLLLESNDEYRPDDA